MACAKEDGDIILMVMMKLMMTIIKILTKNAFSISG
jgi:hypothetical protein